MNNLIIVAYDFPPQSNTASQRPKAWAMNMKKHGINPIVITKNWNENASKKVTIEENEEYTVYRVKTNKTLQSQLWDATSFFKVSLRKVLNVVDLFFHASYLFGPYNDLFTVAKSVIESTEGKNVLICTAKPFGLLKVGYDLNRKTGIEWIADYRDDWTTTELSIAYKMKKFLHKSLYRYQEKKWVSTSKVISSVSDHYVNKILNLIDKSEQKGLVVENGYFENEHTENMRETSKFENLSFVYVGSLYISQNIELTLAALKEATSSYQNKTVDFIFLGTSLSKSRKENIIKSYTSENLNLIFYKRLPKMEALEIQRACHFAVICPHTNLKGIPSSKLYEFIGARMPVIYYPNDHDIIDKNLSMCETGITASSKNELITRLQNIIKNHPGSNIRGNENYKLFSREYTTQQLAFGLKDFGLLENEMTFKKVKI